MKPEEYDNLFRPKREPERTLYDAFQTEADKRRDRNSNEWFDAEARAVWCAACDYAQAHNLRAPTFAEVQCAERSANGHIDYGAKWALSVVECMRKTQSKS